MDDYYLPTHVHCCRRGDGFVFLDLKQDDYTLIVGAAAEALAVIDDAPPRATTTAAALRELLDAGLLTTDATAGRRFTSTQSDLASESLLDAERASISPTFTDACNFAIACTIAATRLKLRHIESTVSSVARRKFRRASGRQFDVERARHLTTVFHRLRAAFPANYVCLFDSLALIEFLARYDVYPTWIFGVRLEPWSAHCWVQQDDLSFNEGVEEAASYTPIMAI